MNAFEHGKYTKAGYTTGICAASAAKGVMLALIAGREVV
jgi:cobalamin biosynthesis protein CbiD